MSLKRRNIIAYVLILIAALGWTVGQEMLSDSQSDISETISETVVTATTSIDPTTFPTEEGYVPSTAVIIDEGTTPPPGPDQTDSSREKAVGFLLSFAGIAAMIVSIFFLRQKTPLLGPDGAAILTALTSCFYMLAADASHANEQLLGFLFITLGLLCVRELWGWVLARLPLNWCAVSRLSMRFPLAQLSLGMYLLWFAVAFIGAAVLLSVFPAHLYYQPAYFSAAFGFIIVGILGICCLWKYGSDLQHFKNQLDNYQHGKPITVGDGAFAQTEAQLLDVQAQHEEAVRTAVTSERFKVELISNVSHDLRTPLTSILGYSELLQNETLSPNGQEQLRRLHQKAGYMNDLVESLFELTKVSSGVVESKKDKIDLVRLLEQTIGLFDDQLVSSGLTVRRSYCADTIPVITDGARMHQVFANLLGNAIKYALTGTRIYLEVKETENSHIIRMMNTASYEMDFKPDEIMQRFARGDKARSTKGSGLGLAIAQTYTESVGGTFRVGVDGDQFSAIVELPKN